MTVDILYKNTSTLPSGFEITFTVGRIVKDNSTAPDRNGANTENDHVDGGASARTEASEDVVALTGQVETPVKAEIIDGNVSLAARESEQAAAPIPEPVKPPAFVAKARKHLRPLCLNPSKCAGYGTHTCHRCLRAAGQTEVAA